MRSANASSRPLRIHAGTFGEGSSDCNIQSKTTFEGLPFFLLLATADICYKAEESALV